MTVSFSDDELIDLVNEYTRLGNELAEESFPENLKWILNLNPMTYIIEGFRDIFF